MQALYITGDKALGNIKVLTPVLDIEQRLGDRNEIENNIRRRQMTSVNVSDLFDQWELNKAVRSKMKAIQNRQSLVSKLTHEAMKSEPSEERENSVRKYTIEGQTLREDLRNLRDNSYQLEGNLMDNFLALPNKISADTPDEAQVLSSHGNTAIANSKHHLMYEDQIDYFDETAYYLKGDAAKTDLLFPLNCVDYFRQNGFVQFSNPDFAKTVLVEGGATSLNDVYEVQHDDDEKCSNLVHLVGNGSMLSFLGFIAKLKIAETQLPLQWVSTGKIYIPARPSELGLYNTCQSTAVQVFAAGTKEQLHEKFNKTLEIFCKFYESTNLHFRVVCAPASELHPAECYKVRIEIFSPHLQRYIEVGSLSNYSDYISKRILFCYDKNKIHWFPHLLSGTFCNVTKLLAILLETNDGLIPKAFLEKILV